MPTALYLHIGHGKTGSSYLQSSLALSLPALEAGGICYPIAPDIARSAAEGNISGGNIQGQPGAFAKLAASGRVAADRPCLISAESLFYYILKHPQRFAEDLATLRGPDSGPDSGPDGRPAPVHVLLYLRDPLDHAVSHYQQVVKRGNYTGTLAENLATYRMPALTLRVLNSLREIGAEVTIRNYSLHRNRLLASMEDWLDLPADTLAPPPVGQVNRSPTRAELELQRLVNLSKAQQSWRVVSDPLCNKLPEIRSEQPPLDPAALAEFLARMDAEMGADDYAAAVPEAERPRVGTPQDFDGRFPDPDSLTDYSFGADQLHVLATAIGAELKRVDHLREQLTMLREQLAMARGRAPSGTE